jgi:hypothetical protein
MRRLRSGVKVTTIIIIIMVHLFSRTKLTAVGLHVSTKQLTHFFPILPSAMCQGVTAAKSLDAFNKYNISLQDIFFLD